MVSPVISVIHGSLLIVLRRQLLFKLVAQHRLHLPIDQLEGLVTVAKGKATCLVISRTPSLVETIEPLMYLELDLLLNHNPLPPNELTNAGLTRTLGQPESALQGLAM